NAELAAAGYPASDAEEMLSRLLGVGRGELRRLGAAALAAEQAATLAHQLTRRLAGEPVQYITGRPAFRHLDLAVNRSALIPRPDTGALVAARRERPGAAGGGRPPRVLDLGPGSGCIALAMAHEHPNALVTATDASPAALAVAQANTDALGLAERVSFA